jgi:hypothetical protein
MFNDMLSRLMMQMRAGQGQTPPQFPSVVGRSPMPYQPPLPQQPLPGGTPTAGNHMIPTTGPVPPEGSYGGQGLLLSQGLGGGGPYQQQGTRLAGLLGGAPQQWPVMGSPYRPGRFMPGFRPGIDTPIPRSGGFEGSLGNPVQRY